jgi:hypothetical protein
MPWTRTTDQADRVRITPGSDLRLVSESVWGNPLSKRVGGRIHFLTGKMEKVVQNNIIFFFLSSSWPCKAEITQKSDINPFGPIFYFKHFLATFCVLCRFLPLFVLFSLNKHSDETVRGDLFFGRKGASPLNSDLLQTMTTAVCHDFHHVTNL